jgi:hypothetical protein
MPGGGVARPVPDDIIVWLSLFEQRLRDPNNALLDALAGVLLEKILEDSGVDRRTLRASQAGVVR